MKKYIIIFVLTMPVLFFLTCKWELPSGFELNGTIENSIPAKMNIGTMFTDELEKSFEESEDEKLSILTCTKTANGLKTFLIHVDLFDEPLSLGNPDEPALPNFISGIDIDDLKPEGFVAADDILLIDIDELVKLPLSGMGDYLDGFKFKDPYVMLYFYGSDIIDKSVIEVTIVDRGDVKTYKPEEIDNEHSGYPWTASLDKDGNYIKPDRPAGGYRLNKGKDGIERFSLDGSDIDILCKIIVPQGEILFPGDFEEGHIKVELVIWLPLEFDVKEDYEQAAITFPEGSLFSDSDLFSRSKDDMKITEMIQNLRLDIMFDRNPFRGGNLVVWSGTDTENRNIEIKKIITGNALSIDLQESEMKLINNPDNWPFVPNFEILFDKNASLKFPHDFTAGQLAFKARIKYAQKFR